MTTRDTAIFKLQQLSEPLLQEVTDFIDFLIHKHQAKPDTSQPTETIVESWSQWFQTLECLEITSESPSNYQQLLIDKYRKQGLEL